MKENKNNNFGKLIEEIEKCKKLCEELGMSYNEYSQLDIDIYSDYTSLYGTNEELKLKLCGMGTNSELVRIHKGKGIKETNITKPTTIIITLEEDNDE